MQLYPHPDNDVPNTGRSNSEWLNEVTSTLLRHGITPTSPNPIKRYGVTIDYTDKPLGISDHDWETYNNIQDAVTIRYRKALGTLLGDLVED